MMSKKPSIDNLDQYLARREYDLALEAIREELARRPENLNLRLRQGEVMVLAGDSEGAVQVYRSLAEEYIKQGFYARAIAVTNKILRVDPNRSEITNVLAELIAARQEADRASREKLSRAATPAPAVAPPASAATPTPAADEGPAGVAPAGEEAIEVVEISIEEPPPAEITAVHELPGAESSAEGEQLAREREASGFFAAFPREALEELLSVTAVRSFSAGDVIVREGDPGTSLFLIEDGYVDVRTNDPGGRSIVLARLGPGDFFGEVSVLTGRPRTATIIAYEPVTLIEIQREVLTSIISRHQEVEGVLRSFYEKRAHATVEAMLSRLRGHGA